jgi:hypothetical protein
MPRSDEVMNPGRIVSRKPGRLLDPITLSTAMASGTGLSSTAGVARSSTARSPSISFRSPRVSANRRRKSVRLV